MSRFFFIVESARAVASDRIETSIEYSAGAHWGHVACAHAFAMLRWSASNCCRTRYGETGFQQTNELAARCSAHMHTHMPSVERKRSFLFILFAAQICWLRKSKYIISFSEWRNVFSKFNAFDFPASRNINWMCYCCLGSMYAHMHILLRIIHYLIRRCAKSSMSKYHSSIRATSMSPSTTCSARPPEYQRHSMRRRMKPSRTVTSAATTIARAIHCLGAICKNWKYTRIRQ